MRGLIRSFKFAFRGLVYCVKNERNFRIHIMVSFYVIALSFFFSLTITEYAVLAITLGLVIVAEIVNTAMEVLVDIGSGGYNHLARIAKDIVAGMVLICAILSVVIGLLIFCKAEGFIRMYEFFIQNPFMLVSLILSLPLAYIFVFNTPKKLKSNKK
jgi:diacylglycerol kinase (ATP)